MAGAGWSHDPTGHSAWPVLFHLRHAFLHHRCLPANLASRRRIRSVYVVRTFFSADFLDPIPRAGRLVPQVAAGELPTAEMRAAGVRLIAFGFFKKYVVANRLSEYVAAIFTNPAGPARRQYSWAAV